MRSRPIAPIRKRGTEAPRSVLSPAEPPAMARQPLPAGTLLCMAAPRPSHASPSASVRSLSSRRSLVAPARKPSIGPKRSQGPRATRRYHREKNFMRQRTVFRRKNALIKVDRRTVGQPGAASSHPPGHDRSGCLTPPIFAEKEHDQCRWDRGTAASPARPALSKKNKRLARNSKHRTGIAH